MSESSLQIRKVPPVREPRAAVDSATTDTAWVLAGRDARVTAYDEHWYEGRPQRP